MDTHQLYREMFAGSLRDELEKRAASLSQLRGAVRAHRGKMFHSRMSQRIEDALTTLKDRMNDLVRSSGGKPPSPEVRAEYAELNKMRKKLQRFKTPRVQSFDRASVPDFHDGSWRAWAASKGHGMSQGTQAALQRGAQTFGDVMEEGVRVSGGGKRIIPAGSWDDVTSALGPNSLTRKSSPVSTEGKEFASLSATLHEVDELKNLRRKGLGHMEISGNHHVGVDPLVLDMNRANTATGAGAAEFRSAIKKQRWDELDFLERNLPPETAEYISRLKRGKRVNRHARKKLNRDWSEFVSRRGSKHDHRTDFTRNYLGKP